jgi:hypothetical protein
MTQLKSLEAAFIKSKVDNLDENDFYNIYILVHEIFGPQFEIYSAIYDEKIINPIFIRNPDYCMLHNNVYTPYYQKQRIVSQNEGLWKCDR